MAKKTYLRPDSAIEGWDALINTNYTQLEDDPLPIGDFASFVGLPSAGANDEAIAVYDDASGTDKKLALSNGVSWFRIPLEAAANTNLTDNSTGTSGGDTIGAVSSVATAANAIATLAAKLNALQTKMRTARSLAT